MNEDDVVYIGEDDSGMTAATGEARRSREAQQKADEATLRQLIEASKQRLNSEALRALQRLLAHEQRGGIRVRIFLKYRNLPIGILRRHLKRKEVTTERTIWPVSYARKRRKILLVSDGRLYDDWQVKRSVLDSSPLISNLHWIGLTNERDGLFANPTRARIQRHVDQIVRGLQQLGT